MWVALADTQPSVRTGHAEHLLRCSLCAEVIPNTAHFPFHHWGSRSFQFLKPLLSRNIYEMKSHSKKCQMARLKQFCNFLHTLLMGKKICQTYISSLLWKLVTNIYALLSERSSYVSQYYLICWKFSEHLVLLHIDTQCFRDNIFLCLQTTHRKCMRFNCFSPFGLATLIS